MSETTLQKVEAEVQKLTAELQSVEQAQVSVQSFLFPIASTQTSRDCRRFAAPLDKTACSENCDTDRALPARNYAMATRGAKALAILHVGVCLAHV